MDAAVRERLHQLFLATFLAAWPERNEPIESIERSLAFSFGYRDGQRWLVVKHWGGGHEIELDDDDDLEALEALVEDIARNAAENAEGDRWAMGAWREWKPWEPDQAE